MRKKPRSFEKIKTKPFLMTEPVHLWMGSKAGVVTDVGTACKRVVHDWRTTMDEGTMPDQKITTPGQINGRLKFTIRNNATQMLIVTSKKTDDS